MSHIWRVAWTIARRDYVAAVFSRLFLIFVMLPLIFTGIGGVFGVVGAMGSDDHGAPAHPVVAIAGDARLFDALSASRAHLIARVADLDLPTLVAREGGEPRRLIGGGDSAVLSGSLDAPRLLVSARAPDELAGEVSLIVEDARATRVLGGTDLPIMRVARIAMPAAPDAFAEARVTLARSAQYAVLVLTIMLAGRLLSSFVEERSNKVIEVLAAVAPVDAIFLGKLMGMLLFSFTCIAAWGALAAVGSALAAPQMLATLGHPAIGWPLFALLLIFYFAACFLLQGAVLLGLGAQANSPADLQTLALPTTIAQLMLLGFASIGVAHPDRGIAWAAALFPWSSPLAMIARAAELPVLWPHLLALAWQALWLVLTIRFAARRFRRGVLKSGGGGKKKA